MKANELMIGDWVKCTDPRCEGHQVDFIDLCNEEVGLDGEIDNFENIIPIPLTPEILEKNGFEKNEYGNFYLDIVAGYVGIIVEEIPISNKLFFEIEYACLGETYHPHTINMQLNYVHELQHALRLCGIDKEIVL